MVSERQLVRLAVLGAGMMARAVTSDLVRQDDVEEVLAVDSEPEPLRKLKSAILSPKVRAVRLDVRERESLVRLLEPCTAAVSCVPYFLNLELARVAVASKCHFCDLGGSNDIVRAELTLSPKAKRAGVAVIPDCGLAPGLVSILAVDGIDRLDSTETVCIRVGGLPRRPKPPLNYRIVFSAHGLINEYTEPCVVLRRGRIATVPPLAGLERLRFPAPFTRLEAFTTSGGASTLPWTLKGKVRNLDCKTIRYPGHCEQVKLLFDLGLASKEPTKLGSSRVVPRQVLAKLLEKKLGFEHDDVILMRVDVLGRKDGKHRRVRYQCTDCADKRTGLTAMMRMTGFPAAVVALMLGRGQVTPGAATGETAIPAQPFITELGKRRINLSRRTTALPRPK
jgi:lysine 6-dehydrogenase